MLPYNDFAANGNNPLNSVSQPKGALQTASPMPILPTTMPRKTADAAAGLSGLRRKVTELVVKNAVPMVQQAIDAVKEEGQYQAIKYLFEMIGLYPAAAQDELRAQESLARTLLDHLGLHEVSLEEQSAERKKEVTTSNPLE